MLPITRRKKEKRGISEKIIRSIYIKKKRKKDQINIIQRYDRIEKFGKFGKYPRIVARDNDSRLYGSRFIRHQV